MFGMPPQRRENEVRTDTPDMNDTASMKLFRDLARALPLPTQWPRTTAAQRSGTTIYATGIARGKSSTRARCA
ncbi:hypothetical protein WS48_29040 [Burkholderia sp. RF7-non_BP1]|nr:hypothetical protein WS48_29040 [Burkholderia sp. RF7-non_BP1]KUY94253.1 hypothetical protein WS49_24950 [Burkholderia sp. RF7-non_BP4]